MEEMPVKGRVVKVVALELMAEKRGEVEGSEAGEAEEDEEREEEDCQDCLRRREEEAR